MREHIEFLEAENRAVQMRLKEVEERFKVVQVYHQQAWYETSMTEINTKAIAFSDR